MSDRFHHVWVIPRDWDQAMAFYRDALGWGVSREWGGRGEPRGAILTGGGVKVVVAEASTDLPADRPILHLDIHNIDVRYADLPQDVAVVRKPEPTPWGTRWFVVKDPDGNLIAFEEVRLRGR